MTDFDCIEPACMTPDVCLLEDRCCALSVPARSESERHQRVKQLIAETRERLRSVK